MKFSGVILLVIIAVAGYLSWNEVSKKRYAPSNADEALAELQNLKQQTMISPQQSAIAEKLNQQVAVISAYKSASNISTDLIALAPTAPVIKVPVITATKQRYTPYARVMTKRYKDYTVSMIFIAPNNRYAVIDEQFSRVGDVLPDGGKVLEIAENYIKVKRGKTTQKFKMDSSKS
ncbi:hypothetical protein [Thiomicrorhabdus lithotrophica]|uniref:Type IV pilus biogenesis protein PilO n=1 Tax=Thiomicrorhabdus lithotrophica TaxID=2949997 RepID=A0ABY8CBA5_9GAMM|nr:hypothetical protein [Thiomicrorhabdus lithotrophica]WEJ62507.1 hypothetical protein NR989_10890 [Thiomicrorhabdus lithotrophica]